MEKKSAAGQGDDFYVAFGYPILMMGTDTAECQLLVGRFDGIVKTFFGVSTIVGWYRLMMTSCVPARIS